jgi:hypothetical protein
MVRVAVGGRPRLVISLSSHSSLLLPIVGSFAVRTGRVLSCSADLGSNFATQSHGPAVPAFVVLVAYRLCPMAQSQLSYPWHVLFSTSCTLVGSVIAALATAHGRTPVEPRSHEATVTSGLLSLMTSSLSDSSSTVRRVAAQALGTALPALLAHSPLAPLAVPPTRTLANTRLDAYWLDIVEALRAISAVDVAALSYYEKIAGAGPAAACCSTGAWPFSLSVLAQASLEANGTLCGKVSLRARVVYDLPFVLSALVVQFRSISPRRVLSTGDSSQRVHREVDAESEGALLLLVPNLASVSSSRVYVFSIHSCFLESS